MSKRFSEAAMITDLSIGHWTARKHDKAVDQEVAAMKQTTEKAGRYNKNLFPFEAPSYQALTSSVTQARLVHREQTLPWTDDGARILLSANHFNYTNLMRERRRAVEAAWREFKQDLPNLKEQSRQITNGLFNEADWPDPIKLEKTFRFKIEIFPFPDSADFRADISELELKAVTEQIEDSIKTKIETAMLEPYRRLFEAVKHMVDRLNSDSENIHDSVVENIRKQCALIPALNLTNDEALDDLGCAIEVGLTRFTSDQLSVKGHLRTTVAARAEEIASELESRIAA